MGESNSSPLSIDTPPITPVADRFPFLGFNFLPPQEKGAAAAAPQEL